MAVSRLRRRALRQGIAGLPECDKSHPITRDVLSRCSPRVQTLEDLLTEFIGEVPAESTGSYYRFERSDTGVWLRRDPIFSGPQASWQMEQFFLASFFRVIRTCTGPNWLPPAITISAHASPITVPAEWKHIDIEWGHSLTSIFIPTSDLESRHSVSAWPVGIAPGSISSADIPGISSPSGALGRRWT